jgi:glycosyltransferase involved in cell wall biosynthesis
MFVVTEDYYFVSHRLDLAIAARAAGYRVSVATRVGSHAQQINESGVRCIPFNISRSGLNPIHDLVSLFRLWVLYMRERPDIVHHVAMKPVLYGSIAARAAGTASVVNALAGMGWLFTSDGRHAKGMRTSVEWCLRRLLRRGIVVVQNPDDEALVVAMGVRRSSVRRIAGSGVDLERFSSSSEMDGVPVVLLPARLLWNKGVGEFVEASRILKHRGVAGRFVLAGEPDLLNPAAVPKEQLEQWVSEGVVEHIGWREDMPDLLRRSHVICLPSYREGLPKSLIEAAAAGRAIVTTDVPGCREAVVHGVTGLLVPPRDSKALAAALQLVLIDRERREAMGARGRVLAQNQFGSRSVIDHTLGIYSELLMSGGGLTMPPHDECSMIRT